MNQIKYISLAAIFILSACAGSEKKNTTPDDLKGARAQLKTKQTELKTLKTDIAKLESIVAKLDTTAQSEKRLHITTQTLTNRTFEHYVEVQGNVSPSEDPAYASSETGGRLLELNVKKGAFVKKGALIGKVDLESISKSIAELEKSTELAEDIFKRQESLWKQNIGSEVQYLQAKNQVESLTKTKERLNFELQKANIYAPASGYVEMIMIHQGEMSGPGSPILQIVNTKNLRVIAAVPEVYLGRVKKGDKLRVHFPALQTEQEAKVVELGRMINPTNRTFEVEASISSKNGLIKPNLLATVFIQDFKEKNAVIVPDELILQDVSGRNYVMVMEGEKAVRKYISLGLAYHNETLITEGLVGNETLIVKGARQAVEGSLLEVIEDKEIAEKQ